jgi:hypothetical protein
MSEGLKNKAVAYFYDEEVRARREARADRLRARELHRPPAAAAASLAKKNSDQISTPQNHLQTRLQTHPTPKPPTAQMTNYNYGGGNPMRPHRVRLTTNLVRGYGLEKAMRLMRPRPRTREEILRFHSDDYVDFLASVTPENQDEFMMQVCRWGWAVVGWWGRRGVLGWQRALAAPSFRPKPLKTAL